VKILLVEDDFMQRQLLLTILTRAGHEVVEAADGQVAWELLQKEHISLVITDWMMPVLSGLELIQRIREVNWNAYTYIILLTSKDTRNSIVTGLNAGADDYVTKPFDRDELLARLGIGKRILDLEARLANLTRHDPLTGLYNRKALYEIAQAELGRAVREGTATSLVMLDLDHFKAVNDHFGHAIGDQALRHVAKILLQSNRVYDYVGRWGGEEFLVLLPNTDLVEAAVVTERMRLNIEVIPLRLPEGRVVELRASFGISSTDDTSFLLETLLTQADKALCQAKASGRNRVCISNYETI
jgi:two-component system chemotaxis response regulator CheY